MIQIAEHLLFSLFLTAQHAKVPYTCWQFGTRKQDPHGRNKEIGIPGNLANTMLTCVVVWIWLWLQL